MRTRHYILIALGLIYSCVSSNVSFAYEADGEAASRYYNEGMMQEKRQKFGRAINAYYHATLADPDFARAHRCIGRVYVKKGLHKNALVALKEANFLDDDDLETHYYLGIVYPIVEHNSKKALEHFKKYLKPNFYYSPDRKKIGQVKKWIRKLKRMGDVTRDEELINTYNRAVELQDQGKFKEAFIEYQKAIEMNPHYGPAREGFGLTCIKLNKFEAAFKEFKEALLIDPSRAESHYGLGIVYPIVVGDEEQAIFHFKRYIDLKPNSPDIPRVKQWIAKLENQIVAKSQESSLYNQGVDAFDNGDFQAAINYYDQAIKINPDYYEAYQGLGLALVQLGQYEDARDAFEESVDIYPEYAEAHYGLGIVLPLLGDKTGGITHFWKYLEYKPDAPDLKKVLKWIEELEK